MAPATENPAAADAENEADEPLDPEVRAEVELAMASAREQIISNGGEPTVGEVVQLAAKTRPDLPEAAIQRVAAEILAAADYDPTGSSGSGSDSAGDRQARLRIDPMVKKAMAEAFAVVLEEFRDATLKDSAVLESVGRQVHGVTGGQMREFAQAVARCSTKAADGGADSGVGRRTPRKYRRMAKGINSGPILDTPGDT